MGVPPHIPLSNHPMSGLLHPRPSVLSVPCCRVADCAEAMYKTRPLKQRTSQMNKKVTRSGLLHATAV